MNKGQITMIHLIGWGLVSAIAFLGAYAAQGRATDTKIDVVKTEASKAGERTAKLEEAVITLKEDNKEIKRDIKEILRVISKKDEITP